MQVSPQHLVLVSKAASVGFGLSAVAVLGVAGYLLSGLFGKRTPDPVWDGQAPPATDFPSTFDPHFTESEPE